ncbi:MAG: hypothetical protein JHC39_05370 [Lentimicrobium sp.]|jgi:hypothetical protein|nr:hypothetical protein [Lentimicrobium sp.]
MKKLNLTKLLLLCCLTLSCNQKTEKKQPTIYYNNQNYKFDDDEILKKNTKDTQKITHSHKDNLKKVSVKK